MRLKQQGRICAPWRRWRKSGTRGALVAWMVVLVSRLLPVLAWFAVVPSLGAQTEPEPPGLRRVVAVKDVCAWPNLTLMPDGSVTAVLFNQPAHGTQEGDLECWGSNDGVIWEKRGQVTRHAANTARFNHAAGLAHNGDLVVLCSGWTNEAQAPRPKQAAFRDAVLRSWVLRSADGGRSWSQNEDFPAAEPPWTEFIPFGDIWKSADGILLTSCYQGRLPSPGKSSRIDAWRSWCFRSDDDGKTWQPLTLIGAAHNETAVFPLGDPRWLAVARAQACEFFISNDNGATWAGPQRMTERNEINGHLTRLHDGRLLLTYGVRVKGREGVCVRLGRADALEWSPPARLAQSNSGDCGYPSSVQLADGRVVTAYYSKSAPEYDGYHLGVAVWTVPWQKPASDEK